MLRLGRGIGASRTTSLSGVAESSAGLSRSMRATTPSWASASGRSKAETVRRFSSTRPTRRSPPMRKVATFIGRDLPKGLFLEAPGFGADAGELAHARLVGGEAARRTFVGDAPVVEHIDAVGDFDRLAHILLDEQDRDAFAARRRDDPEHFGDDERREALRRLVEHKEPWIEQERARDRQHLLLAARELAALVGLALGEARKCV